MQGSGGGCCRVVVSPPRSRVQVSLSPLLTRLPLHAPPPRHSFLRALALFLSLPPTACFSSAQLCLPALPLSLRFCHQVSPALLPLPCVFRRFSSPRSRSSAGVSQCPVCECFSFGAVDVPRACVRTDVGFTSGRSVVWRGRRRFQISGCRI